MKIVIMGNGGVGKSALVIRFTTDTFVNDYDPTLEDNYRKDVQVDNKEASLDILDTAGQEEFQSLHERWINPAGGFLLMYSITDRVTFEAIKRFKEKIIRVKDANNELNENEASPAPAIVLVGNKCDLENQRQVLETAGQELANSWDRAPFYETSAKDNTNVTQCFDEVVRQMRILAAKVPGKTKKKGSFCLIL